MFNAFGFWSHLHAFVQQVVIGIVLPILSTIILLSIPVIIRWLSQKLQAEFIAAAWNGQYQIVETLVRAAAQHPDLRGADGWRKRQWVEDKYQALGVSLPPEDLLDVLIEAAVMRLKEREAHGIHGRAEEEAN